MLAQERRRRIFELIQEEGSARVAFLSDTFAVSEPTIRQDLEKLELAGHIQREHGGAFLRSMSTQVRSLSLQHTEHMEQKAAIAHKALQYINDGDHIILDSGSTITELARILHSRRDLTVVTNAINIALIVGAEFGFQLFVTGGEFKASTLSLTGDRAEASLAGLHVDKLFLATGGISADLTLTYPGLSDIPVKRAMIKSATTVFLLADSTKLANQAFATLGPITDADYLITDSAIAENDIERITALGVKVIIAG